MEKNPLRASKGARGLKVSKPKVRDAVSDRETRRCLHENAGLEIPSASNLFF